MYAGDETIVLSNWNHALYNVIPLFFPDPFVTRSSKQSGALELFFDRLHKENGGNSKGDFTIGSLRYKTAGACEKWRDTVYNDEVTNEEII